MLNEATFSELIRTLRTQQGMIQSRLALIAKCSVHAVREIESGENPIIGAVFRACEALGITLSASATNGKATEIAEALSRKFDFTTPEDRQLAMMLVEATAHILEETKEVK
jgi:transcriptional regulator with XRE-family HTH domain